MLSRITEFIKKMKPDIVGLIEVDNGSYRNKRRCQALEMAKTLGYVSSYNSKYAGHSVAHKIPVMNKQGNAFLTRPTIKNTTFHFFNKGFKRLAIELELEQVTIFLVHLSLTYRSRQWQLNGLYDLLKEVKTPAIVAGDFNMFWGRQEMQLFLAATGLVNANHNHMPTYPSQKPTRQLDFILHSPQINVTEFQVCKDITYSGHLPIFCQFEV